MLVKMRMTKDPISVSPDTSILEAWKIMQNSQVRRLLVIDKGKLVGIVTERDLRSVSPSRATSLSIFEINYLLEKLKVKEAMTSNPITVDADAPIEEAALIMKNNKVSALPVIEEGKVVGIITESDIFRAFIEMLGEGKRGLRYMLRIKNTPGEIAKVVNLMAERGINIMSMATFPAESEDYGFLVLRLETEDFALVNEIFRRNNVSVEHIRKI
ncbi:MAG TPA: CBS and ACT domain-containing protein [Dictyoglomaceae bacterium]|nr:CBS and ACT domain-containing protein [Dictyoglomaceae bacterium]HOL39547.1 CBS and ACT domain-containing protein [Dictyoglomaceae bacterium]HOP94660.1 CBS and ACT domain-containing protein [Dictyoglomaceae bacterium]HPP16074.1 CBS and ACT domain-containing protein [Dictyoglomaceae bacterium]